MKLAAVLLVFKEQPFLIPVLSGIYPVVDTICVVTAYDRNFKGKYVEPDETVSKLLDFPDPDNKLRFVLRRDLEALPGKEAESKLRNAAIFQAPDADYYLIVDSDEVWESKVLGEAWRRVQKERLAGYRVSTNFYFKKWNLRGVEPGDGYRPLVFLKRGFVFENCRNVNWWKPARWLEYLRTGRKPKTVYFPKEIRMHHGSSLGDDARMKTKLLNWGHAHEVDPTWFEEVWLNPPAINARHYMHKDILLYERLERIPTADLPPEITAHQWPEGWIDR
ncbi:MAG: hypothetical protein PHD76_09835 [Methylacidiphilales bacterium]|nr:hypothetical protein [Candidatus Methylacidiphilales bacterium]